MTSRTKSLLKYLLAFGLLALLLYNTNSKQLVAILGKISLFHALLAFIAVNLAQIVAAGRMRYFFHASGFAIRSNYAIILFYVGAFYNFILPGGIGGDAYKVMIARKRLNMETKQGICIMLADRASGLCVLILMLLGSLYLIDITKLISFSLPLLVLGAMVNLAGYLLAGKWLLKQHSKAMLTSLLYSLLSQSLWLSTVFFIWLSLGTGGSFLPYSVLYCAASITTMLPVSVGGLGIREMTCFYGANLMITHLGMSVDAELAIALSLSLFAFTFISSLPSMFWLNKIANMPNNR